ncbi:beta-L-arabinofuranosidase domain-containing protein [uncultured Muribaculum sp.]|uniref:beta-L-arabinofuranosidase domain-containing protein n=2 Tax=uncultured Muribaculum sp. TaxID=1918613 RepID=UPI002622DD82|nr:beta-L-arabinofuranosidase domain-containing protein [uncultured Muribaculum sp.]
MQEAPLIKLPVGSIRPVGWLRRMLELQRDGLNGQLGSISAWLDKNNNQWLSDSGDHGWEEVPYWLRGYSSLAYILDDESMKKEAKLWFDAVLSNIKEDGFIGPRNFEGENPELWAQMIMLWALQTYYEYSGDNAVLTAMTNYFKWEMDVPDERFIKGVWQEKRGGDNLWSVLWLYNRTGDTSILPLADKLHRNTSDWTMKDALPNWHGVNVAQGFREPATYYMLTGEKRMLDATYAAFEEMRCRYGRMPGGMYAADENARVGYSDPRNGAETCAVVEHMASDELLMAFTGDPFWADHCENVAFNTLPAAFTEDMKALRYITSANMAISDEKLHGPSIDNNLRGMLSMSPFSSRCCQHNHGMGWPYFAEHLTMATADDGIATMLYASNEATVKVGRNGRNVRLKQETYYPFDGVISLEVETEAPVEFPLYLRIPSWAKGAETSVNGIALDVENAEGRYVRILREWKDGDKIKLDLPMNVSHTIWPENKNSISVNYGPLTLSLKIDEIRSAHDSRDHEFVQDDSHWQDGVDASKWPCYVLKPASSWNYGLKVNSDNSPVDFKVIRKAWPADDYPFSLESCPLEFTAVGVRIPSWGYDDTGMTDILPDESAERAEEKSIPLIPMGAARLRISAFPKCR